MRIGVLALLGCALAVARVSADSAGERAEARREFAAGQAADQQRDWQTAIEHYERANALVPHPNTMFNIATNYERLGKLRDGAVWYQRYLDAAPDSPDRDRVAQKLRELKQRNGTITVRSQPTGARVAIDGKAVGITPYSDHLASGDHSVTVELDNAREVRPVKVEFGEPVMVDVKLTARPRAEPTPTPPRPKITPPVPGTATGTLRVIGGPPGARVFVDGQEVGVVPLEVPIFIGNHQVRVEAEGYAPLDETAVIDAGRESVVSATLTRAPTVVRAGYLVGFTGGIDTRGEGQLALGEFGVRTPKFDGSLRVGKMIGLTAVDVVLRWRFSDRRLAPYISAVYSFMRSADTSGDTNGSGFGLEGGLRLELARSARASISISGEAGFRYIYGIPTMNGGRSTTVLAVPVMTAIHIQYR